MGAPLATPPAPAAPYARAILTTTASIAALRAGGLDAMTARRAAVEAILRRIVEARQWPGRNKSNDGVATPAGRP